MSQVNSYQDFGPNGDATTPGFFTRPEGLNQWPEAYRKAPHGFTNDRTVGGANFTAEEKAQLKARMGIK